MKLDPDTRDVILFVFGLTGMVAEFATNALADRSPTTLDFVFLGLFAAFAIGGAASEFVIDFLIWLLPGAKRRTSDE